MKDVCELCSLCSPQMGCTKLSHESCLKEAIKLIKPSVTNGEMFLTAFPQWKAKDLKNGMISVEFDGYYELFYKSWWNRKWGE